MSDVSIRLREVWEWKKKGYEEVKHLPLEEQLKEIVRLSKITTQNLLKKKTI